jgi:hypothetical protein
MQRWLCHFICKASFATPRLNLAALPAVSEATGRFCHALKRFSFPAETAAQPTPRKQKLLHVQQPTADPKHKFPFKTNCYSMAQSLLSLKPI